MFVIVGGLVGGDNGQGGDSMCKRLTRISVVGEDVGSFLVCVGDGVGRRLEVCTGMFVLTSC